MGKEHFLLADPWNDLPGHSLYDDLAAVGIGPDSSRAELREGFFELMERGMSDGRAEEAYHVLQIVGRRLAHDATRYDPEVAPELLEFLVDLPEEVGEVSQRPLHEQIPFSWDV